MRSFFPRGLIGSHLIREYRGAGLYYCFIFGSGLLGLLKGLIYATIFRSEGLGYYALATLAVTYCEALCHFGLYRGLECVLPSLYGAGREAEAQRLRNATTGLIAIFTVGLLFFCTAAWLLLPLKGEEARGLIIPTFLLTGAVVFFGLVAQDLRSRMSTVRYGASTFMRSASCLLVGTFMGQRFGYRWALIGEALVLLLLFALIAKFWCRNFRFDFRNREGLGALARVGYPLTLKSLIGEFASNLDRWCIAASLGVAAFGQYAFASIAVTVGALIHAAISMHIGPRGAYAFGASGDIRRLIRSLHQMALGIVVSFAVGWLPFLLITQQVLPNYFPEYKAGIALLPILYWAALFQVLSQYEWVPMTTQTTSVLLPATIVCGLVTALLYGVAVISAWPLSAYAWIFVSGRALICLSQVAVALRVIPKTPLRHQATGG